MSGQKVNELMWLTDVRCCHRPFTAVVCVIFLFAVSAIISIRIFCLQVVHDVEIITLVSC